MAEKLSECLIRFEDIPPYLGLPKNDVAGYFRPEYIYVGPRDKAMRRSGSYDFHLVMVPIAHSTSAIHVRPQADILIVVISGQALFWDEAGDKVLLKKFDALYLRDHPYAYRNSGTEDLWMAVVISPPDAPKSVYKEYLFPKNQSEINTI